MSDNERSLREGSVKIPPSSNGFDQAVMKQEPGLTNSGSYLLKDGKLSKLLKSWQNMEPSSSFESNVWRCIRQQATGQHKALSLRQFLREWTSMRPAYATVAAAIVGIVAGVTSGLTVPAPSQDLHNNLFKSLPERSLSASYVHLVGGKLP